MTLTTTRERRHFIVKHDLQSLLLLPNYIWRTDPEYGPSNKPRAFGNIEVGDRWVGFAYTSSDLQERPSSHVTGLFECVHPAFYGVIPAEGQEQGWLIKGARHGEQHQEAVRVPPITELLKKSVFHNQTLIPISEEQYEDIRRYTLEECLAPKDIPILKREPKNEQEVLAVVASAHESLGIRQIKGIQTGFPDLLAELDSGMDLHLELEMYSSGYFAHGHNIQVEQRRFKKDKRPVAILCWIHDDKSVEGEVPVYVLPKLLRHGHKIASNGDQTTITPPLS